MEGPTRGNIANAAAMLSGPSNQIGTRLIPNLNREYAPHAHARNRDRDPDQLREPFRTTAADAIVVAHRRRGQRESGGHFVNPSRRRNLAARAENPACDRTEGRERELGVVASTTPDRYYFGGRPLNHDGGARALDPTDRADEGDRANKFRDKCPYHWWTGRVIARELVGVPD